MQYSMLRGAPTRVSSTGTKCKLPIFHPTEYCITTELQVLSTLPNTGVDRFTTGQSRQITQRRCESAYGQLMASSTRKSSGIALAYATKVYARHMTFLKGRPSRPSFGPAPTPAPACGQTSATSLNFTEDDASSWTAIPPCCLRRRARQGRGFPLVALRGCPRARHQFRLRTVSPSKP